MRDAFREKSFLTDPEQIYKEYTFGMEQLQMLHRQVHCMPHLPDPIDIMCDLIVFFLRLL